MTVGREPSGGFFCFCYVDFSFFFETIDLPWRKILRKPVNKRATDKIAEMTFINIRSIRAYIILPRQLSRATFDQWTAYRVRIRCIYPANSMLSMWRSAVMDLETARRQRISFNSSRPNLKRPRMPSRRVVLAVTPSPGLTLKRGRTGSGGVVCGRQCPGVHRNTFS
jgi:hypothetical protein